MDSNWNWQLCVVGVWLIEIKCVGGWLIIGECVVINLNRFVNVVVVVYFSNSCGWRMDHKKLLLIESFQMISFCIIKFSCSSFSELCKLYSKKKMWEINECGCKPWMQKNESVKPFSRITVDTISVIGTSSFDLFNGLIVSNWCCKIWKLSVHLTRFDL